ncbi:MAG: hypothetical protein MUP33_09005, partial [Polaromonas sp.]|nr:hypothetical protein [Polaromonas sp.]
ALEIASGMGQPGAWFSAGLPHWTWPPTDAWSGALNAMAESRALHGGKPCARTVAAGRDGAALQPSAPRAVPANNLVLVWACRPQENASESLHG